MKFFLFFLLFLNCQKPANTIFPKAINGYLDLTEWDFSNKNLIFLDGEWEFYYGETENYTEDKKDFIRVPSSWHNTKTIKKKIIYDRNGFATYKLKVKLNPNHDELILQVKKIFTSYKLFINDELFSEAGKFSKDEKSSKPWLDNVHSKVIAKNVNVLEIVIQVSNYHHRRSGLVNSLALSSVDHIFNSELNHIAKDVFLAGGTFLLFIINIGLFFLRRKEFHYLYFSLVCLLIGSQTILTGEMFFLKIFPNLSWEFLIKSDYLSTYNAMAFYLLFLNSLFPIEFNKYFKWFFNFIFFGFSIIVFLTSSSFYTLLNPIMEMFIILAFIYLLFSLIYATFNKSKGSLPLLASTIITFIAALNDIFFDVSFFHSTLLTPYSLYFVFASQSFILSFRYADAYDQNEKFRFDLENSKIDLEKKISDRTKDLYLKNYELSVAKLEAEKSNQIKSNFLANISHEIRTPLNGVIGITSLLKDSQLNSEQKNYLDVISNCGETIISIINDILDLSKIESGNFKFENREFNLIQLVENSINLFEAKAKEKNLVVKINFPKELKEKNFLGDSLRITQILNNLLSNAIKFSIKNGFISFNVNFEEEKNQIRLKFEIHDTGIGISENKLEEIFEPFKQSDVSISRKFGGTGLGLSICKKLILMMGGSIYVKSKLGEGSSFYFNFILENSKTNKSTIDKPQIRNQLSNTFPFKILVVDDNSLNQMILQKFLNKLGYKDIKLVSNGIECIEFLKLMDFDLIFMDIDMPEMDGIQATNIILNEMKLQPIIIAFTANAVEGDKEKYLSNGFKDHLTKPLYIEKLQDLILYWGESKFQKK